MIDLSQFSDMGIVARTIYGENRGGGIEGMQSVANTIMNRANAPGWWGDTPRAVCLKPKQFDCWIPTDPNYEVITELNDSNPAYSDALDIAQKALAGTLIDLTHGATYYFAQSMPAWPHWAVGHVPCATIQGQLFFNDIS
jgi:spore germination cell wall hydrolase CwlJ-like protein